MDETDALEHRLDKVEFLQKPAINHFLARVPVREVAVEPEFWKAADELHSAPHVLENGCTVSLHIERDLMSGGSLEHAFYEAKGIGIIFDTPADMQSCTAKTVDRPLFGQRVRVFESVNPATRSYLEPQSVADLQIRLACGQSKLDTVIAGLGDVLEGYC